MAKKLEENWTVAPQNSTELWCGDPRQTFGVPDVSADFYWTKDKTPAQDACFLASTAPKLFNIIQYIINLDPAIVKLLTTEDLELLEEIKTRFDITAAG